MTRSIDSKKSSGWSDAMTMEQDLCRQWLRLRERLQAKRLLTAEPASLSLRIPASDEMWFGLATDAAPQRVPLRAASGTSEVHAAA